jgi:hypothetical protein
MICNVWFGWAYLHGTSISFCSEAHDVYDD